MAQQVVTSTTLKGASPVKVAAIIAAEAGVPVMNSTTINRRWPGRAQGEAIAKFLIGLQATLFEGRGDFEFWGLFVP